VIRFNFFGRRSLTPPDRSVAPIDAQRLDRVLVVSGQKNTIAPHGTVDELPDESSIFQQNIR